MTPQVRVVVLNHNGGATTLECLHRLEAIDYPRERLELVLIDNGSSDDVAARTRRDHPDVTVIESPVNLGFAGGNNLALRDLDGVDCVALVNNDVLVEPGWLQPLVDALEADPGVGAACPKILLADPMLELEIRAGATRRAGRGDRRERGVRVSGVRVDGADRWRRARPTRGFWGREHGDGDEVEYQWTAQTALLQVPVTETDGARSCEVRLAADEPTTVELVSGRRRASHLVGTTPAWYPVELDGTPFDVINNVGSELVADGYGADRGYLQRDVGQYDEEEDVFAWCGAAVLLRTRYLETAGLFDERLFLYYEDLELSWRGLDHGWRHRYVPKSVVRHLHSATTVEGSALAEHFNERNHLLVLTRHAPRSVLARALLRYLLVTASYARRDLVSRWLRRERPRRETVRRRVHALASFVPRAPAMALDPHERYAVADPPRWRRPRITRLNRFTDYRLLGANLVPRAGRLAPAFIGTLDRPAGRTVVGHTGRVCRIEGWVVARTGRPVTVLARLDGAPVVETAADEPRPDVVVALGRRFPVSPRCGFSFFVDLRGRLGDDGARLAVEFSDGVATSQPVQLRVAPEPALLALETYAGMSPAKLAVAARLLRGRGVELGALHQPLPCDPEQCVVQFVDRLSREEALATFPELAAHAEEIVSPDFLVDLDTEDLSVLRPHGFDFFIANDVIEHVANPLRLLRNVHDAMKPGALFFLSAPDCDYTFDAARPLTTRRHLWREYKRGTTTVDRDHVRDFVRGTRPEVLSTSRAEQDAYFDDQLRRSIHVHVWNQASFDDFLDWAIARLRLRLEVIERVRSRDAFGSMTYVLRKTGSD